MNSGDIVLVMAMTPSELDRYLGKVLGINPDVAWQIVTADEKTTYHTAPTNQEAEAHLRRWFANLPDGVKIIRTETYRQYSGDWNEVLTIVHRVNALFKTRHEHLTLCISEGYASASWGDGAYYAQASGAPLAICRCAVLVLMERMKNDKKG